MAGVIGPALEAAETPVQRPAAKRSHRLRPLMAMRLYSEQSGPRLASLPERSKAARGLKLRFSFSPQLRERDLGAGDRIVPKKMSDRHE